MDIYRTPTENDKQFMDVDLNRSKKQLTTREKFKLELNKHEKIATKNSLPFARHAAIEDFEESLNIQVKAQLKKWGAVDHPELLEVPKIDFKQYSDLKNFKVISEKYTPDTNLSNKNPGLNVEIKTTRYQYKDYESYRYIVMESGPDAIKRAVINRAKLDKEVSAIVK